MTNINMSSLLNLKLLGSESADLIYSKCVCIAGTRSGGLFDEMFLAKVLLRASLWKRK